METTRDDTIDARLARFVVVEPDGRQRKLNAHGAMEEVTLWRVVLVHGTDRRMLIAQSSLEVCRGYAEDLRHRFLSPLLREATEAERAACIARLSE